VFLAGISNFNDEENKEILNVKNAKANKTKEIFRLQSLFI